MIRKKIHDLNISQAQKADFKKLDRASFSVTNDRLKATTTYAIEGVAGYGIGQITLGPETDAEFIGFLTYTRQSSREMLPRMLPTSTTPESGRWAASNFRGWASITA